MRGRKHGGAGETGGWDRWLADWYVCRDLCSSENGPSERSLPWPAGGRNEGGGIKFIRESPDGARGRF